LVLVFAGGMAVSGVALTIGALEGEALFGRDTASAWMFAAVTVAVSALAGGWCASSIITRLKAVQLPDQSSGDLDSTHLAARADTSEITPWGGGISL
jgi:hypothetical protein